MKRKDKVIIVLTVFCMIATVLLGLTYAYWTLNKTQEGVNVIESSCFNIEFTEANDIELKHAIPISDEQGMQLTPYTFAIQNTCDTFASYQINLETFDAPSGKTKMNDSYIRTSLQKLKTSKFNDTLKSNYAVTPTVEGATNAYKLAEGTLRSGKTDTYNLRIWMDKDVTADDLDSMSAYFSAKVSVTFTASVDPFENSGVIRTVPYDEIEDEVYSEKLWAYREEITEIEFQNSLNPITGATYSFDLSSASDNSVMAYLVSDGADYKAYIQGNGGVKANPDSSLLFYGFSNLQKITGLQYFDTRNVTNMMAMFAFCTSLEEIDLSNFDTSKVTDMSSMFVGIETLTTLDLSEFDTSKVTTMEAMFNDCLNLIELDISNFNTSNVTTMESMFESCEKISSLDLSSFNTSKVTNMSRLFRDCKALLTLNLSNFNTSKVTDMSYMFQWCRNLTALDISSFDTSKVTNMQKFFDDCYKVNTTLTIRTTSCNYNAIFSTAATVDGSQIIINYTTASESLVDGMLTTKMSEANIVKAENPIS